MATVSRDLNGASSFLVEGGSLLLACGGVCVLGDIAHMRKDRDILRQGEAFYSFHAESNTPMCYPSISANS